MMLRGRLLTTPKSIASAQEALCVVEGQELSFQERHNAMNFYGTGTCVEAPQHSPDTPD